MCYLLSLSRLITILGFVMHEQYIIREEKVIRCSLPWFRDHFLSQLLINLWQFIDEL